MDISSYAKLRWKAGSQDPDAVARDYIQEALNSDNPVAALHVAVREMVVAAQSTMRRRVEDRVLGAGRPAPVVPNILPRSWQQTRFHQPVQSSHDNWMTLLETKVWIAGRGMIPWEKVSLPDIEETISAYDQQIQGVQSRIAKLNTARDLMKQHGVSRFGDVPDEDRQQVIAS